MFVIGTAGHVDHGKSTLVLALTGIDPDRLKEEKAREMTIDLGFAWMTLPSGREVSIVDVPGHERFIKNMLAGAGGLDAALLVIAADEGPMPQTEEHLAILHLLGVDKGIVVLTKRDLVDDEWLALVEEEVRERIKGTTLEGAEIVPISARTGQGLAELKQRIDALLEETHPRADKGKPRLPVDRVFTIAGFGTVVTGTLTDGTLHVGQEVMVEPGAVRSRIRGLQSHKHKAESIGPGNRVAVNLAGLEVSDLRRGMVLTTPAWLEPTSRVDIYLNLLADAPGPVEQNDQLDLFTGSSETVGRITLLDTDRLEPGSGGWAQLRLQEPIAVVKGDRYIVRLPSPSVTIGGGEIIDPHPRRHKRFHEDTLQTLETLQRGTPEEMVLQALGSAPVDSRQAVEKSALDPAQAYAALSRLVSINQAVRLTGSQDSPISAQNVALVMSASAWDAALRQVESLLRGYHRQFPLRRGMGKEELRSRMSSLLPTRAFGPFMSLAASRGLVGEDATTYRLPDHQPTYTPLQRAHADRFMAAHAENPYSPPSPAEMGLDSEVLGALVDSGELVKIDENIYYTRKAYEEMREKLLSTIDMQGEANVATMRDLFGTTRKYAIPFLEHLDDLKVTRRVGDVRVRW